MQFHSAAIRIVTVLFILAQTATARANIVFTNDTAIAPTDLSFDGADIVISNCTLTVSGPHTFASLFIASGGKLTHSFWPSGTIVLSGMTQETYTLTGTNAVTLLNSNIYSDTIVVQDFGLTVTYTNGSDYVLTSLTNGMFQLQRTDTSAIPDGATVRVNYSWLSFTGPAGLNLSVTGDVQVAAGGAIIADGNGYGFSNGAGRGFSSLGGFYDGSGAGHGGFGGISSSNAIGGACYGSFSEPTTLGSPGGASFAGSGGNGGGAIQIFSTGNFVVDGLISANGANATNSRAGGGSGGSIWISATNFSGAGTVSANGGAGEPIHGGGGGGGRIAIQTDVNNFTGAISAAGGSGWKIGGAGTVYTQVTGQNPLLLVDNGGRIGTNSLIALTNGADVLIRNNAGVMVSGAWTAGNLIVATNGSLLALPQVAMNLSVTGNMTVQAGGIFSADISGSSAGIGVGAGHIYVGPNYYPCSGAGYGGAGAMPFVTNTPGGVTYGLQTSPTSLGSGGGNYSPYSPGGAGGGAIQLTVSGALQMDGRISANGGNGSGLGGGGGSGGGILINAGSLSGAGIISANGGSGVDSIGGGGGGGRIAIFAGANSFSGSVNAFGGGGANWGGAGTVLIQAAAGGQNQIILDNSGHSGTNTPLQSASSSDLILRNGAIGSINSGATFKSLLVSSNSALRPAANYSTYVSIYGNATIQSGGGIIADAAGYGPGIGSSAGHYYTYSPYQCSGGGHGGFGGNALSNAVAGGSAVYDSYNSPYYLGSGGGTYSSYSIGGAGGGAFQLTVSGTLQNDGVISANGGNGSGSGGGGGAGGSLNLSAVTVSGSGVISANGGNGVDSIGGGGGGGMIAIAFNNFSFNGNLSAYGGFGAFAGGAGTIYLRTNSTGRAKLVVDNGGRAGAVSSLPSPGSSVDMTLGSGALAYSSSLNVANLNISSNAWLIASNSSIPSSAIFIVYGNATIRSGGGITADSLGFASATGPGAGRYEPSGPFYPCSGAGHGGYGANASSNAVGGITYDSSTTPSQAGSGGGGYAPYSPGGRGGGILQMTVNGLLKVDGTISANGGAGMGTGGGGGSGGSLNLSAGTLSGAGAISANGGNGSDSIGGGGGGGIIAVNFTSNSFAGVISAFGGGGANFGGAGTIYLKTNSTGYGSLIVDNGGHRGTNTPIQTLSTSSGLVLRNGAIAIQNYPPQTFSGLFISSNAWLTAGGGNYPGQVNLTVNGNATIQAGGGIITDAAGSTQNIGAGRGNFVSIYPMYQCSGGGYGGFGASSVSNYSIAAGGTTYGSTTAPNLNGSGGGGYPIYSIGGAGGGYVNLQIYGSMQLDGIISANGGNGSGAGGGGGSGGSVQIVFPVYAPPGAGVLSGSGAITANGGSGVAGYGGGGGGGRIAITYTTNLFAGTISALGGSGANWGGAGTIYLRSNFKNLGQLILDNGGHSGTNTTFDNLQMDTTIQAGAIGFLPSLSWTAGNILIRTNGTLTTTTAGISRTLSSSSITIDPGGVLSFDGAGYTATSGPGYGTGSGSQRGGGGHGGYGAANVNGGGAYDSIQFPAQAGSGGANYYSGSTSYGGAGGGALQVVINNNNSSLTVNGRLSANGTDGQFSAGGGAGGSLIINAPKIIGSGIISANGGAGSVGAGGGGGGRIAINSVSNNFSGQLSATGGNGSAAAGGAGTIYFSATKQLLVDNGYLSGTNTPLSSAFNLPSTPFNLSISSGAKPLLLTPLPLLSNLNIGSGSVISSVAAQSNLVIAALQNIAVSAGGAINLDNKGFTQTNGSGAGASLANQGAGGGYGGIGGDSSSGAAGGTNYGSATQPVDFGSGGGLGSGPASGGSEGGGAIRLMAGGTLSVDGTITVNGDLGLQDDSGGGSGGSVWITAGALTGSGAIFAIGGDGDFYNGGGGSGGRIAIYAPSNFGSFSVNADGGDGANVGQTGTIFVSTNFLDFQITSQSPTGLVANVVSSVDLNFNGAVDPASVLVSGFSVVTPNGSLAQSNLSAAMIGVSTVRVSFPLQNVSGDYSIQVAPGIQNIFGQPLSQSYSGGFTIALPAISGTVVDTNGQPVAGVALQASGLPVSTTDTNGNYSIGVAPGFTGSVTPSFGTFMFIPGSLNFSNVTASVTNQNFVMVSTIAPTLATGSSGTNLFLNWSGMNGVSYQIFSSTNLTDWQPLTDIIPGTNAPMQFTVPMTNAPQEFFRVQAGDRAAAHNSSFSKNHWLFARRHDINAVRFVPGRKKINDLTNYVTASQSARGRHVGRKTQCAQAF
jgi:hypothetical protein